MITIISYILQTCIENPVLLFFFFFKEKKPSLNHQAPLFCCHNCGPFRNLISWSTGSRADAILNGIIEVLFFFFFPCVQVLVFVIDVPCPPRDGRCKALLKACRKPSSLYCLIRRGGVRWARRGNTFHCWYTTWAYSLPGAVGHIMSGSVLEMRPHTTLKLHLDLGWGEPAPGQKSMGEQEPWWMQESVSFHFHCWWMPGTFNQTTVAHSAFA